MEHGIEEWKGGGHVKMTRSASPESLIGKIGTRLSETTGYRGRAKFQTCETLKTVQMNNTEYQIYQLVIEIQDCCD
jgi:hypothetical protein